MTSWSDDEYSRVSRALFWQANRKSVTVAGYITATDELSTVLDIKLKRMTEAQKAEILAMADQILAMIRAYLNAGCGECSMPPDIVQVDKLRFDPEAGDKISLKRIKLAICMLSSYIDHPVNWRSEAWQMISNSSGTIFGTRLL